MTTTGLRRGATVQSSSRLEALLGELTGTSQRITEHRLYAAVGSPDQLTAFMESHVFAVWDFMNLVKAIQHRFAGTAIPWTPRGNRTTRRFVNEIVLEEESDEHPDGDGFCSHFELYLAAMTQAGADTAAIDGFLAALGRGTPVPQAAAGSGCAPAVRDFLTTTWGLASSSHDEELVAGFALGRETLIPAMFERLLADATCLDGADLMRHYLSRHVVLDGEQHSVMALQMLVQVCGEDPDRWARATATGRRCLEARLALWDSIVASIERSSGSAGSARPTGPPGATGSIGSTDSTGSFAATVPSEGVVR